MQTEGSDPCAVAQPPFDRFGFLVKDYELKITYFTNHMTRMWTRFGMFVTLESALVAVLIVQGNVSDQAPYVALVELVLSTLWFLLGRHDRRLIRIYRKQIADAAASMPLDGDYVPVSDVSRTNTGLGSVTGGARVIESSSANEVPLLPVSVPGFTLVLWSFLALLLFDVFG